MCAEDATRQELLQFWVAWDPYACTDESWAPDFVSRAKKRARPDPEMARFLPVPAQEATPDLAIPPTPLAEEDAPEEGAGGQVAWSEEEYVEA
eukprot:7605908-Pyramimonas_sp.AAC.2